METIEVGIGNKTVINVVLKPAQKDLQEVVVVGYGTRTLREASREQVEGFVAHLADWAEKDRNALLCQLNSYPRTKDEGAA